MPFLILVVVAAVFSLLSFIVMSLWNGVLTAVLHVSTITFWQAAGILVLSKILFGFGGGPWKRRDPKGHVWRKQMMEKWSSMTPEERIKFKQELKNRCGRGWHEDDTATTTPPQKEA